MPCSEDPSLSYRYNYDGKGLTYTLYEGHKLGSLSKGDSKHGDGDPWEPTITVSGGDAAFYSIGVSK